MKRIKRNKETEGGTKRRNNRRKGEPHPQTERREEIRDKQTGPPAKGEEERAGMKSDKQGEENQQEEK